jgi:hypothetical protein
MRIYSSPNFYFNSLMFDSKEISISPIRCNQHSIQWTVCVTNRVHLAVNTYYRTLTMSIPVSFLYVVVSFLHTAHLWGERLGMSCSAKHARKSMHQAFLRYWFHIGCKNTSCQIEGYYLYYVYKVFYSLQ